MTFRTKIFIGAGIVLAIIALVIIWVEWKPKTTPPVVNAPVSGQPAANAPAGQQPAAVTAVPAAPKPTPAQLGEMAQEVAIKNQARNFAERFGSWSVIANFSNFDELKNDVTASVATWLDTYKKQILAQQVKDFVGVTTQVITEKVISSSAAQASVLVSTQREETLTSGSRRYYKDMLIKLVLVGERWLIDGAFWQ